MGRDYAVDTTCVRLSETRIRYEENRTAFTVIYTDGSKFKPETGWGFLVQDETDREYCGKILDYCTVYQAEIEALAHASELAIKEKWRGKTVQIL